MTAKPKVAVIGTGASAIQFIPPIADEVARLDVYQRTAPYIAPRRNPRYPAAVKAAIRWVPGLQALRRHGMTLFMESFITGLTRFPPLRRVQSLWATLFMRYQVRDPEFRKRIWPDYPFGCKRILFSSHYLPALQRPNVDLVTDPIERITPTGIRTTEADCDVDIIVYATGFDALRGAFDRIDFRGKNGVALKEKWEDEEPFHLHFSPQDEGGEALGRHSGNCG